MASPTDLAFFTADPADPDVLLPTGLARSSWSADQMHGVAVAGALGRAAERCVATLGRADLRPARLAVDLFRPAAMSPCTFTAEVVREGNRICLVDVALVQDGRPAARAAVTFLLASQNTEGEVWSPTERPSPPSTDVAPPTDVPHPPYLVSDAGWTQDRRTHSNASHKVSWNSLPAIVAGETCTPWQAACAIADASNLVINWGTKGVEYINSDVTLSLARPPLSTEIGLSCVERIECDGLVVGSASMFDRQGPIGTVMLTGLANARRAVVPRGLVADASDPAPSRT